MPRSLRLFASMLVIGLAVTGCDGDDDPIVDPPTTGSILIDAQPDSLDAPWQLAGPGGFVVADSGDSTLLDLDVGDYTVTWGTVTGWTTPSPAAVTRTLTANGSLTFTGTYLAQTGSITINPEPNSINAPWQISGPGGFSQTGNGDATLGNMTAGSYTLTWGAVTGWMAPAASTQTLDAAASVTFAGTYDMFAVSPELFAYVNSGQFSMGSPADEPGRNENGDEVAHTVALTRGFYLLLGEVTNQQYTDLAQWAYDNGYVTATNSFLSDHLDGSSVYLRQLGLLREMTFNNGTFQCTRPDYPAKFVTWYGAAAYCDWLSLQQGLPRAYNHGTWSCNDGDPYSAAGYRLPTEAEWEYACRAGSTTAFTTGLITNLACAPVDPNLELVGWYCGNAADATHPSRQKNANAWGVYDLHGNVWEWCNDWYGPYTIDSTTDPTGATSGTERVLRGGSWSYDAQSCRSAYRGMSLPSQYYDDFGFRVVLSGD